MADFATIKAKVKAKVVAQTTYFADGSVFDYDPEIDGITQDPFAIVVASANDNEYASSSENKRTYAFSVRIFVERNSRGNSNAEGVLQSIVDALIDAFDQDYTLGGTVLTALAAPSRWGYVLGSKEYRVAEVTIKAKTWFDVT